jgi:hypothetical protein
MVCRESLIAFVKESAKLIELPSDWPKPKASDFTLAGASLAFVFPAKLADIIIL